MFECGINTTIRELSNRLVQDQENFILNVVKEIYVDVDKEKLTKCLYEAKSFYDDGYEEGYNKGFNDAMLQMKHKLNVMYAKINGIAMEGDEENETSE